MNNWNRKVYIEIPKFTGENVPVSVAARVMKKTQTYIRQGIIEGRLDIGTAIMKEGSTQYDYYISPFKLWQETGYIYDGSKK